MTTISSSEIAKTFESRKDNPQYNTSYPLEPEDWGRYEMPGTLPFDVNSPIALYIHIPYCRNLCSFCEYTRTTLHDLSEQENYIGTVENDIENFLNKYKDLTLYGLDIGGGTPTALDDHAFWHLLGTYNYILSRVKITEDFEPSIEATFQTLSPLKLGKIFGARIQRISIGIQSTSTNVLTSLNREILSVTKMKGILSEIHSYGIQKVNIDLMYGLPGQTIDTLLQDVRTIEQLNPKQVTIYEFRTNQLKSYYNVSQSDCFRFYNFLYEHLIKLGYFVQYGANTFSRNKEDFGLSSYLRHRMLDGWQYKGFGVSAQSMSKYGVAYNIGKYSKSINKIINESQSYESSRYYRLPPEELLSKFIAISGYSGGFSIEAAKQIYGLNFEKDFNQILNYLIKHDLIFINSNRVQLTNKGMRHYGSVLSLFYPHHR